MDSQGELGDQVTDIMAKIGIPVNAQKIIEVSKVAEIHRLS